MTWGFWDWLSFSESVTAIGFYVTASALCVATLLKLWRRR